MSGDPRKLNDAAATALDGEGGAAFGEMSGRFGVRVGVARRPSSPVAPRRPARTASRQADPLVDVHFDGVNLIVTTETDDAGAEVSVEAAKLTLRSRLAPERNLTLPCRVKPDTLSVHTVNGILEATMAPVDFVG